MQKKTAKLLDTLLTARGLHNRDPEEDSRFVQFTAITVLTQFIFWFFCIYSFHVGRILLAGLLAFSAISLLSGWFLLFRGIIQKWVYRGNCLIFASMTVYLMYLGQWDHSMVFWMFISPLLLFFFMGRREGALWVILLWLASLVVFIFTYGEDGYDLMFMVRFMLTFGMIASITYTYEYFRDVHRHEVLAKNTILEQEIQEREKVEDSLRESEARYRAIYLQAVEGILLVSSTGEIIDNNPQILQMLGYGREQLIGKNVFSLFHPENLKKIPSQLDRLQAGESILVERQILTASGKYLYCEQSGKKISDELIILLYRDITDRKIAERALETANQTLEKLANIDGLTGVANRRRFDSVLSQEWRRGAREQLSLGLLIFDVDYFKQFNDIYGHQAGDDCLVRIAKTLQSSVHRPADLVARYGGEEFVVLAPDTDKKGCQEIAEKLRRRIQNLNITHHGSRVANMVTISCGFASMIPTLQVSVDHLISLADQALYAAKEGGRNQVRGQK